MLVIVPAFISSQWENEEKGFFVAEMWLNWEPSLIVDFTATLSIGFRVEAFFKPGCLI